MQLIGIYIFCTQRQHEKLIEGRKLTFTLFLWKIVLYWLRRRLWSSKRKLNCSSTRLTNRRIRYARFIFVAKLLNGHFIRGSEIVVLKLWMDSNRTCLSVENNERVLDSWFILRDVRSPRAIRLYSRFKYDSESPTFGQACRLSLYFHLLKW